MQIFKGLGSSQEVPIHMKRILKLSHIIREWASQSGYWLQVKINIDYGEERAHRPESDLITGSKKERKINVPA